MDTTTSSAAEWAESEFGECNLGDKRRTRRLVLVAARLADGSEGTLPGSFSEWSELKGAYRLFDNKGIAYESIVAPHRQRVLEACSQPGEYLMIEDTSTLDYSSLRATTGLGRVGDDRGRGLFLHTTLAVAVHDWDEAQQPQVTLVGVLGQKYWARTRRKVKGEKRKQRLTRPRESQRWAKVVEEVGAPPADVTWTYIADRESDIYETLMRCQDNKWKYIIRANQARALANEEGSVFTALDDVPELGRYVVDLRARPGQAARRATMALRSKTIELRAPQRPGGGMCSFTVTVVDAREVDAPAGVEPLHWTLLTNWPAETFQQALRVVQAYTRRWLIEEYHKALKSGVGIENTQLTTAARITALLGILVVVAVRLLGIKLLAGTHPDRIVPEECFPAEARAILDHAGAGSKKKKEPLTYGVLIKQIAMLGGFPGRKGDGDPGWQTIWRGWKKLMLMLAGYRLARYG